MDFNEKRTVSGQALLARLPFVRGKLIADAPLAASTWFRVGGVADVLFKPADEEDLALFLAQTPVEIPVTVMGVASNTLVRDGGVRGVVIRLGPEFAATKAEGVSLRAGSAAVDLNVARAAEAAHIANLEFLCGIPGTVGGGLRMNAGAYGREFKDVVTEAVAIDRAGKRHVLSTGALGFSYRHCSVPEDMIFVSALFTGVPGAPESIKASMAAIQKSRQASQPIREKTGGSTFANPDGFKAWQLIDSAGCRGLRFGGAMVSEQHCNFLINTGTATAEDIEFLGEEVRRRVREHTGIELRWEIRRIGESLQKRQKF